jgi:hypothetical protein
MSVCLCVAVFSLFVFVTVFARGRAGVPPRTCMPNCLCAGARVSSVCPCTVCDSTRCGQPRAGLHCFPVRTPCKCGCVLSCDL